MLARLAARWRSTSSHPQQKQVLCCSFSVVLDVRRTLSNVLCSLLLLEFHCVRHVQANSHPEPGCLCYTVTECHKVYTPCRDGACHVRCIMCQPKGGNATLAYPKRRPARIKPPSPDPGRRRTGRWTLSAPCDASRDLGMLHIVPAEVSPIASLSP